MSELVNLKKHRSVIKAGCTRIKTYIESLSSVPSPNLFQISVRKEKLTEYWKEYNEIQLQIEILDAEEEADRNPFELAFYSLEAEINALLNQSSQQTRVSNNSSNSEQVQNHNNNKNIRLPKLNLPVFSGNYEDWVPFSQLFQSTITNNENLSNIERFQYLKSSLKGEAADEIKALDVSEQNFSVAWSMLESRYDKKRVIINKHIQSILDIPCIKKENHQDLRFLINTASKHINSLTALKRPTKSWDDLLIHILGNKLDPKSFLEWENSLKADELPTIKQFFDFLNHRCLTLESVSKKEAIQNQSGKTQVPLKKSINSHVATVKNICSYCNQDHPIYFCSSFTNLSTEQRFNEAKKRKLCINCLRSRNHTAKECSSGSCKMCGSKHNTLLHFSKSNSSNQNTSSTSQNLEQPKDVTASSSSSTIVTHNNVSSETNYVLLSTARVYVFDRSNQKGECRALLDSGSQANLITKRALSMLQLKSKKKTISINGINEMVTNSNQVVNIRIQSIYNAFETNIECIVTEKITDSIPNMKLNKTMINIPKNIKLADPKFNVPGEIDLLLGAELFWQILCIGQIKQSLHNPVFQKTHLGWILGGSISNQALKCNQMNNFHLSISNQNLDETITKFWKLEEILSSNIYTQTEKIIDNHFIEHVNRDENGRFIVELPIKPKGIEQLGSSKEIATKRFLNLERKLNRDDELKSAYCKFMQEYESLGHMRIVDVNEVKILTNPVYYMPHHCVFKNSDPSKKIRVVFDASSKTDTGVSLNDILMPGPVVQPDLFSIIIRFRMFRYVFVSDIVKMYRQIWVHPDQTSLQRILWRCEPSQPIKVYELLTVTYGTVPGSFLATRCLKYLAETERDKSPVGCNAIENEFYVDDWLSGADSLEQANAKINQVVSILGSAGFVLDKWRSNSDSISERINRLSYSENVVSFNKDENSKILGLQWSPQEDSFQFTIELPSSGASVTKRSIISEVSRIFDPLGLLSPIVVAAKLIIQQLWKWKLDWDASIPMHLHTQWCQLRVELQQLQTLEIPRCVLLNHDQSEIQLHGFADASQVAYGACCYLRIQTNAGTYQIALLSAKSRIAPMKATTLPRLELCAALLLAQLVNKITQSLQISIDKIFMWTDSSITLAWIRSPSRKWNTFVANRVSEIQNLSKICDWYHVNTKENPADLISRSVKPFQLITSEIWWHGPKWLEQEQSSWPISEVQCSVEDIPEKSKTFHVTKSSRFIDDLCSKYSSLKKLLRVFALCQRFVFNCNIKSKKNAGNLQPEEIKCKNESQRITGNLQAEEIKNACYKVCKLVQECHFREEIEKLSNSKASNPTNKLLSLAPFYDEDQLLRVGGRIRNSNLPNDVCHPILLPKDHPLVILIIRDTHISNHHSGVQTTIYLIRKQFWPLSLKTMVRQTIRKCVICFKTEPIRSEAIMGDLPANRIQPSRPFSHSGIDFGGPFYVREGKRRNSKTYKAYIAVFVCFVVKAIHIELVPDLSTNSFLAALKRFISRRGKPVCIYTDNGSNFVGAARELQEWYQFFLNEKTQVEVNDFLLASQINWKFIPPYAPHYGGLWEAAVKSAKFYMKRIIGAASLNYDEMATILCEIEAILNSRPIMAVSNDPNDLESPTPGHFLIGDALNGIPQPSLMSLNTNRLSNWQRLEQMRQHFWQRWSNEYLTQLQGRNKWKRSIGDQLGTGQLVLVQQPGLGPLQWILGRVIKIHSDIHGVARSAEVKTSKGLITRSLTKLSILPLE